MSADGQRTNWFRNIAKNFNRLSITQLNLTQLYYDTFAAEQLNNNHVCCLSDYEQVSLNLQLKSNVTEK